PTFPSARFMTASPDYPSICPPTRSLHFPAFPSRSLLSSLQTRMSATRSARGSLPMTAVVASLPTLKQLQTFVHKALCAHDHLDPAAAPLYQALITRSGRC